MPRLSDSSKSARQAVILDAALRCFAATGFSNTSMADIIAESGLSAGSIYSHFSGKQEIVLATAGRALDEAQATLEEAAAAEEHGIAPRPLARMLLDSVLPRNMIVVVLQFWAESPNAPELAEMVGRNLRRINGVLAGVLRTWAAETTGAVDPLDGEADDSVDRTASRAADQVMLVVHGYLVRISLDPSADPVLLQETALELLPEV